MPTQNIKSNSQHSVGSTVKIKSLGTLKKEGREPFPNYLKLNSDKSILFYVTGMEQFCDKKVTIATTNGDYPNTRYRIEEDSGRYIWTDAMLQSITTFKYPKRLQHLLKEMK